MKNLKKTRVFSALAVLFTTAIASALVFTNINFKSSLFSTKATGDYKLVLDSSNAVTSAGEYVKKTIRGGEVTFKYTNVTSSSGNHTRINEGGSIVNKDRITSIDTFAASYSGTGTLKARISYTGTSWGEYFAVGVDEVEIGSHPYFLEMKADGGYVDLSSATFEFTCTTNPDAEPQQSVGSYDITFKTVGSDSASDISSSSTSLMNQVSTGSDYISSFSEGSKIYAGTQGLKFGSSKAAGSLTINFDSSEVTNDVTTISLSTAQYGSDSGQFEVYINESSSSVKITPSSGGSIPVNGELTSITFETTTKRAYLCGLSLNYDTMADPSAPLNPDVTTIGFNATDENRTSYTINSVFATDNALHVTRVMSNSDVITLSPSEYSYVITDSNSVQINPTEQFPAIGTYTLSVSYKSFIPINITLNVGEYVYVIDVTASMTKTTFNTADILSEYLSANLSVNLEYSNNTTSSNILYSEFATYGIAVKLLNPRGTTADMDSVFGSEGTWTLKVYSVGDENMAYSISLTVNAIPVTSISLDETSASLYPEGTLQLVPTVGPANATNQAINWSSNNEDVATVSDSGLVTAIAVGGATITATAVDGSNVFGTCSITVTAKPAEPEIETLTISLESFTNASNSYAWYNWSEDTSDSTTVSGKGEIYKDSNTTSLQFNRNKGLKVAALFNTTAIPGSITKIEATTASGTNRDWSAYVSSTAYSASSSTLTSGSNATLIGDTITVDTTSTVLGTSSSGYSYFCIQEESRSASFIEEFKISYATSSTPVTPVSPTYPTSISVSGSSPITIGETTQLSVGYTPSTTNVKNVTFSSSNSNIASVSNTGLVTGVAQGNATITATAEAANNGTVSNTFNITVNPISVTSVSLDTDSVTIKAGKTSTLVATVYPTNATNRNVTWSSNNTSVATVSGGVVTAVAAGTAKITVSTVDGNKTATCTVTVTASSSGGEETYTITYSDLANGSYPQSDTTYTAASGIQFQAYYCANFSSKMQFKASKGYIKTTESLELQSLTINGMSSNALTVYGGTSVGSFTTEVTGDNGTYNLVGFNYFKVIRESSGMATCDSITIVTGTPTPTDPTSIILSPTSAEIKAGGTKQLSVSYVPSNANQNKDVTWTSNNTNVATVSSTGLVSVKSTATDGQTATITAKLTNIQSITATCIVTVVPQSKDDHTVLIYMCGSNLESDYASSNEGLATGDIQEILSVSGQPDDVNIVIETGGANSWSSKYGISSSKLERWHVENRSLVKDASLTYASMGLTSTLQSFIEYGLNNYPADRTGIIFWNHGGAMRGVCYDEKKDDDCLLTTEVSSAVSGALNNCGMSGQKLEWIGYDACLMQVQDIASINSDYFNYMIASEESESGYGWDYDTWVDDLYAKKSTSTILQACVDGFIKSNGGTSSSNNDQTLSFLNLSYMSAYITAWNNMATQLGTKLTSSNKSSFNTLVKSCKYYADSDYTYYGIFDAKDFINKLSNNSTFNPGSSYTNAVLTAFNNLVEYASCGKGAGNSNGLCLFWSVSSNCQKGTYYTASMTKLTAWRTLVTTYGS